MTQGKVRRLSNQRLVLMASSTLIERGFGKPKEYDPKAGLCQLDVRLGRFGIGLPAVLLLRARPEIIESTFDRVNIEFTTTFSYHIWWL
jgi:hypothetical protein